MSFRISGDEVRARLRTLTSFEISDTTLATAAYIPAAEAWLNIVLSNNGTTYSGSDATNEQPLLKAAQIAFCCNIVIASAPERSVETAGVKIKGISSTDKEKMLKVLKDEWERYFNILNIATTVWSISGNKYHVAGTDPDDTILPRLQHNT